MQVESATVLDGHGALRASAGDDLRELFVEQIPALRAFARSLCRNSADADDVVQDALTKAWAARRRFEPGTNLRAWLFTILRNTWYTTATRRKREVSDSDGAYAARLTSPARQQLSIELDEVLAALHRLPPEQREALSLIVGAGASYEEAAEIANCALGTIKSRVHRARANLASLMGDATVG